MFTQPRYAKQQNGFGERCSTTNSIPTLTIIIEKQISEIQIDSTVMKYNRSVLARASLSCISFKKKVDEVLTIMIFWQFRNIWTVVLFGLCMLCVMRMYYVLRCRFVLFVIKSTSWCLPLYFMRRERHYKIPTKSHRSCWIFSRASRLSY